MRDRREESEIENGPPVPAFHRAMLCVTGDEDSKTSDKLLVTEAESDMLYGIYELWPPSLGFRASVLRK